MRKSKDTLVFKDNHTNSGNPVTLKQLFDAPSAGSNTQILFNDAGTTAGNANLTFDKATKYMNLNGFLNINQQEESAGLKINKNNAFIYLGYDSINDEGLLYAGRIGTTSRRIKINDNLYINKINGYIGINDTSNLSPLTIRSNDYAIRLVYGATEYNAMIAVKDNNPHYLLGSKNETDTVYIENYKSAGLSFKGKINASNIESGFEKNMITMDNAGNLYKGELPHAFFGFADSSRAFTLASNATWYKVTNSGNTLWYDYESDGISISSDNITLGAAAHWEIHYHVVFTGSTGVWFKMRLYNVTKAQVIPIPTAATAEGANLVSIGNTGYCTNCDSGDVIQLQMIAESNSQTITLIDGSILIKATHGVE